MLFYMFMSRPILAKKSLLHVYTGRLLLKLLLKEDNFKNPHLWPIMHYLSIT